MSEPNYTDAELQEITDIENRAGSYGRLVLFITDSTLTELQHKHCHNVLAVGDAKFGAELRAQYGEQYPLDALALRIDHDIERYNPTLGT